MDGDSILIALLHHESSLGVVGYLITGTMRTDDLIDGPPLICIYRIATRTEEDRKQAGQDRKRAEEDKKPKHEPKAKEDARRAFEYVNIPLLHHALRDMLLQCTGRMDSSTHSRHHMSMLLGLIGLTGTDFTRGMPQVSRVSGKTVFSFLPSIWVSLMGSYDPLSGQLEVDRATDRLVACICACKFASHFKGCPATLRHALETLKCSKLSQRTVESLPSVERVACTVLNVNWLIQYWCEPSAVPDPLCQEEDVAEYWFERRRGVVCYACE